MSAIRLARAATGRDKLLKFAGAYHGHVDGLLAAGGLRAGHAGHPVLARRARRRPPRRRSSCPGTTPRRSARAFAEHEFAAVLVEPYPANMGLIPPAPGFLELLRDLCTGYDALLVFDEVITGFRVAPGGAQELTGVLPDLTVMGKIIGGGLPGRGVRRLRGADGADRARRRRLPGRHAEREPARGRRRPRRRSRCWTSRPTCPSATPPARWPTGLREAAGDRPVSVTSTTGLVTVFFAAEPPTDYEGAAACDTRGLRRLVPRAAGPRRLSARLAVRGLVPVHRPHRRAHRPHGRGGRRGVRRGAHDGALATARATAARATGGRRCWPARVARRDGARSRSRTATPSPAAARATRCSSRRSARATCSTTRCGRVVRPEDPDLALLAGDRLYALGLERLAAIGDLDAVAELADVIALCAQAHAEGDPARADAVWDAGARGRRGRSGP